MKLALLLLSVIPFLSAAGAGAASASACGSAAIRGDRWLETDLYWFDRDNIPASAGRFWDRFEPLFAGVRGWRGVILNVGWTASYLLDWRGDLAERIPLASGMTQWKWFASHGPLTGSTQEQRREWQERFRHPVATLQRDYQPWTYSDLRALAQALREQAANRGLGGVRIGSLIVGWSSVYGSRDFPFALRHPNVYLPGYYPGGHGVFDPRANLTADASRYGAYPSGIPNGLPVADFLGRQWGAVSRAVGLDALVLRDSMIGPVPYRRAGPYGSRASPNPEENARWTRATAQVIRRLKQANPTALIIGYSSGASAVGEWRVGCVDLESIAEEGFLDAYIDQTWGGAWNEVGSREGDFWNRPLLGWTYQLADTLVHAAQLAGTKTRHYVLTETFDAWESWDTIHSVPQRLQWGIWAYLHAAVKTPRGLLTPQGTYISWANQGNRLLSEADVAFLADQTNAALRDAQSMRRVLGPTLVYDRPALLWQEEHAPQQAMGEWIDEQAGTLLKWGLPILSSCRIEDLSDTDESVPLIQTPIHLGPEVLRSIEDRAKTARPAAFFGHRANGIDPTLAALAGPILRWDPPELAPRHGDEPLAVELGSVRPYLEATQAIDLLLAQAGDLRLVHFDPANPVAVLAWEGTDGRLRILAGDLEEGLRKAPRNPYTISVALPKPWQGAAGTIEIKLSHATSRLYQIDPIVPTR